MAVKRVAPDKLMDLLAGSDRPIRVSLHTSADGYACGSVDTTLGALSYPSAPITFNPLADGVVLTWTVFDEDEPDEEDD